MMAGRGQLGVRTHLMLHLAFALTGILQAIGGPLLPSIASEFHLNDGASGFLFLMYFAGTSLGAFFCRANYSRAVALGFVLTALCCLAICFAGKPTLPFLFLPLGIGVGIPMSGISLFVGRAFPQNCAATLSFLNFSWSAGALVAPLLAARILIHHSFREAYVILAILAILVAAACAVQLRDAPEEPRAVEDAGRLSSVVLIVTFACATFLQVGVENTAAAWLSTYSLRTSGSGLVLAAASTSFYWTGFLLSRGLVSLLLLRAEPVRVFRFATSLALAAAILLDGSWSVGIRNIAMFLLGVGLAPIYPLVIAGFFARARRTADSRWVLACAGFGGSILPGLAGWLSVETGSLRVGVATIPAALLLMLAILPALTTRQRAAHV